MDEKVLEVINLKKYYGNIRGVENVSFTLKSGETYGFIGPNGSGKSTTIRSIMNLINKTSGIIKINGVELDKNNIKLKEIIGYLPSEIYLYDDLTVKEMLDFHGTFYKKDLSKKRNKLVKVFKLDESKRIEDLSLGNKKKLGIVLAFMHEPKILILDEPTSGLDPVMQNVFYELLAEEKKKGTTIFYSTHILSEVSKICDRIGIIKDGVIVKEVMKDDIIKNSILTIESDDIKKIKDVLDLKIIYEDNKKIQFINTLSPNELIVKISKFKMDKILIEEVSLDEIFMEYYK